MKILKILFALLGLVGLAVGGYYLFQSWLEVRNLWAIANANRSSSSVNPTNMVLLTAALAAGGGLLLGLGIGLPGKTAGGIRKETLREVAARRESEISSRARAASDPTPENDK